MPDPLVAIVMGSRSDWATLEGAAQVLAELDVSHEVKVVSAHRTPVLLQEFATGAEAHGIEVIIAGAGARPTCRAWSPRTQCCPFSACP